MLLCASVAVYDEAKSHPEDVWVVSRSVTFILYFYQDCQCRVGDEVGGTNIDHGVLHHTGIARGGVLEDVQAAVLENRPRP